jgi:PAS domain S-box-containing protein
MIDSLKTFRALVENSSDAISLVTIAGEVLYASASAAKVLGYQPEELLGMNSLDLLHPEDRDRSVRTLKKLAAQPQSSNRTQGRIRQKDGRWLWVECSASNLLDVPEVGAIVLNYRDISSRKAVEEERQRLAEELARCNAELQAFAHTVAHDLREPVRTISAFTQLLARKARLPDAEKEIAQFIVDGARRMSNLLDDLLSSATGGHKDSLGPVELAHVAAQAIQNLTEALTVSGAAIKIGPLPRVQGRECDLVRLFQNLIGNAVKYRSPAPIVVHVTAERSGPDWMIRIRDNGIGIAKHHHLRVFGLFTRLHSEEIPGTGIGLAVCKEVVEGLGGTIWVESEPGAGSTFCFTLAAAQEESGMRAISSAGDANGIRLPGPVSSAVSTAAI